MSNLPYKFPIRHEFPNTRYIHLPDAWRTSLVCGDFDILEDLKTLHYRRDRYFVSRGIAFWLIARQTYPPRLRLFHSPCVIQLNLAMTMICEFTDLNDDQELEDFIEQLTL